jgi:membrane-associated phospholipid phosphatase
MTEIIDHMNIARRTFLLLSLLSISCGSSLFAQNTYNFSQFGDETGRFVTQPLHWEGSDWLKFGLIGAGTFLAMQADQPIRTAVLRDQRYNKSVPIEGGRIWGESYTTPILAVAFGLHGWLTDNSTTKKIGFEIGQAIIYSAEITQVLSKSVGRARPNQNLGRSSYQPFTLFGEDYHSLPGGHSSAAFVLSTILSRNLSSGFLKVIVYIPAVVTLASRVYQDYHWTSDDLLGAAIGYFVADWVVNQHDQKENRVELSSVYPFTIRIHLN